MKKHVDTYNNNNSIIDMMEDNDISNITINNNHNMGGTNNTSNSSSGSEMGGGNSSSTLYRGYDEDDDRDQDDIKSIVTISSSGINVVSKENNYNNNHINKLDISPQVKDYWRSRLTGGLIAIIFLQFLFLFAYVPYIIYFIDQIINSQSLTTTVSSSLILLVYHIIFIIVQTSLFKTTFTDPGSIPMDFPQSVFSDAENIHYETNSKGEKRKCSKCSKMKPDRSHHCSKCKRCILKMDHHCPFVNNCVGFFNYKYFVLFLSWTTVLCFYTMGTTFQNFTYLLDREIEPNIPLGIVFIIALVFGLGLAAFAGTHILYVMRNETTIEHMEKKARFKRVNNNNGNGNGNVYGNPYNRGSYHNFCQVFGSNPWVWFLPIRPKHYYSRSAGMIFPVNYDSSFQDTSPLIGYNI